MSERMLPKAASGVGMGGGHCNPGRGLRNEERRGEQGCSCNVGDFVTVHSLDVVLLHERFDVLFDIRDLGREARLDLLDDLLHKLNVLHLLARLHDAHNGRLQWC